ncbi:MAG: hypothetical protein PF795_15680, partial [Kiritimatiellae bacterium]|nr:hypothetical protein [Kiritimatiellia bacterium]
MNRPDSQNRELENAILLEQSGELTDAERENLYQTLQDRPGLADWARESRAVQAAGLSASEHLTPPLPELNRDRLLKAANQPTSRIVPRLLAG